MNCEYHLRVSALPTEIFYEPQRNLSFACFCVKGEWIMDLFGEPPKHPVKWSQHQLRFWRKTTSVVQPLTNSKQRHGKFQKFQSLSCAILISFFPSEIHFGFYGMPQPKSISVGSKEHPTVPNSFI